MAIRNFVYLDDEKLKSISSQVFEGVAERFISSQRRTVEETNTQTGPKNSGQVLADIFLSETSSSETRFLSDHAYSLFEDRLESDGKIYDVETILQNGLAGKFIKVKGLVCLNDMATSTSMLRNFNKLGLALWRVTNDKMSGNAEISSDKDAKRGAIESDLQLNEKVSTAAAEVMEFGYRDLLEIFMSVGDVAISAPLKREFLRESESLFLQKFTRLPSLEFTVVGLAVRIPGSAPAIDIPDVEAAPDPKAAMRYLALHMSILENEYIAAGYTELVIDPIAVYSEIEL